MYKKDNTVVDTVQRMVATVVFEQDTIPTVGITAKMGSTGFN